MSPTIGTSTALRTAAIRSAPSMRTPDAPLATAQRASSATVSGVLSTDAAAGWIETIRPRSRSTSKFDRQKRPAGGRFVR